MNNYLKNLKQCKDEYSLVKESFKVRFKISIFSVFLSLLFVISPILIIINLFIFYDFIKYNIILLLLAVLTGVFLYEKFYFEGLKSVNSQAAEIDFLPLRIETLFITFIFSVIGYVIAIIIIF